jgi:aminopeptidase
MTDRRISNLARILVQHSVRVQPGDRVAIEAGSAAEPLIREVYRETLRAGGLPFVFISLEGLESIFFSEANEEQLTYVDPVITSVFSDFDVLIVLRAEQNTRRLSTVPPERQRTRQHAYAPLMKRYMDRSASGELRWVITLFPTHSYAQDAEMSLEEFADFAYSAMFADADDPLAQWEEVRERQAVIISALSGKRLLEVKGPNADLRLSIEGRSWNNSCGQRNIPDGEIFTSPVEDSAEGWIRFDYPAVYLARAVEGVELTFDAGRIVKATAEKNEEFLLSMLDTDAGSRYLGEFAIGTNQRIARHIKSILFDEKLGGTIHLAIGTGFKELGGTNESAVHWDMISGMGNGGRIYIDGELFYDSGEFAAA